MAIYVTSDIHGYPLNKFKRNLQSVGFGEEDWLYILGDVIDRNGDGGVDMLVWLLDQPNVQLIRGNHEQMMLECSWLFDSITEESIDDLDYDKIMALGRWQMNGSEPTMNSMKSLLRRDIGLVADIIDYIGDAPICETVEAGERAFILCHSGFKGFDKSKRLSDYALYDILWNRPNASDRYFDDVVTVLGHTPTGRYGCDGRAFITDTWIDVDVGGAMGRAPMLLRLDDMKEFYF